MENYMIERHFLSQSKNSKSRCIFVLLAILFIVKFFKLSVTTLPGNPKGPIELGNPNNCAEVKLCLFLFMLALEIVCRETWLSDYWIRYKTSFHRWKKTTVSDYKEFIFKNQKN